MEFAETELHIVAPLGEHVGVHLTFSFVLSMFFACFLPILSNQSPVGCDFTSVARVATVMLRVYSAFSGELLGSWGPETEETGHLSVKSLKIQLAKQLGTSRFRQKCLQEQIELADDTGLRFPSTLKLMIVNHVAPRASQFKSMIAACSQNSPEELEALLQKLYCPDLADQSGKTSLHVAASAGHAQCVRLLIEANATVDMEQGHGRYGLTALHMAAHRGHIEVVQLLLEADAFPDKPTFARKTALHLAFEEGHWEVGVLLIENGARNVELTETWFCLMGFFVFPKSSIGEHVFVCSRLPNANPRRLGTLLCIGLL